MELARREKDLMVRDLSMQIRIKLGNFVGQATFTAAAPAVGSIDKIEGAGIHGAESITTAGRVDL
jgi:hypothetical protein